MPLRPWLRWPMAASHASAGAARGHQDLRSALRFLLICLLFGILTNILVAWTWQNYATDGDFYVDVRASSGWVTPKPSNWPLPSMWWDVKAGSVDELWLLASKPATKGDWYNAGTVSVGWPFGSLGGDWLSEYDHRGWTFASRWLWSPSSELTLALRPIWPGFAANTALYTLLFAAPVLIARGVRRWQRRRAGLCISCAYDLRGSSGLCPECGRSSARQRKGRAYRPAP